MTIRTSPKKKFFIYTLIPLMILLLAIVIYATYLFIKAHDSADKSYEEVEREGEKSQLRTDRTDPVKDNVSILLIGVDDSTDRNYSHSRSDALLVAVFNKPTNSIKLLSIPRDTYLYVPKLGYHTKINHAHFYGGPKSSMETVEKFLNIPIEYYISFNFEAFIEIIDSLGGIYFDVPYELYESDSHDNKNAIHLMPGYQKLNGEQALALVRSRKYDSDVQRGIRQQEIIKSIVNEATSTSSVFKLGDVIEAIGNNMKTNLTFEELTTFAIYGLTKNLAITTLNLDGSGGYMDDGLWYYQIDETSRASIEKELREHLELPAINTD